MYHMYIVSIYVIVRTLVSPLITLTQPPHLDRAKAPQLIPSITFKRGAKGQKFRSGSRIKGPRGPRGPRVPDVPEVSIHRHQGGFFRFSNHLFHSLMYCLAKVFLWWNVTAQPWEFSVLSAVKSEVNKAGSSNKPNHVSKLSWYRIQILILHGY